jgi:nucleotide-binding universal stress UspA family protein
MRTLPTKILLATDGSRDAQLASRAAVDLCRGTGAELHVVHVWANVLSESYPTLSFGGHSGVFEEKARVLLAEQAEKARSGGAKVAGTHLKEGRAAEEVVGLAEDLGAGLVVLGGRGVGALGRLLTGSVSEGVSRLTTTPTLVVRGGDGAWPPRKLIICDDSSDEAARAGNVAASVGRLFGIRALLVRVYPPRLAFKAVRASYGEGLPGEVHKGGDEDLKDRADGLENVLGTRPEIRTPTGAAAGTIRKLAEQDGEPPLIAMGSRGSNATTSRLALGSVSAEVMRSVAASVLIVPPPPPGSGRR